jgi:RNA polymerase sigma-70 factor (ECF subfamily)
MPLSHNRYETPAQIAAAIYQGDKAAEAALFERYYHATLFFLERRTRNLHDAEDVCQETFRITIERLRSKPLEEPDKLAGFVHNTAMSVQKGDFRKLSRRKTFTDQDCVDRVIDRKQDQLRNLIRDNTDAAVRTLVDCMKNERDRKILYRFYIQEKEKDEICAELDLDHRHFDRVLYRAKQRFKKLLLEGKE